jgi:hypothetical protein
MQMAFLSFGGHDHDLAAIRVPDEQPVGTSGLAHTAIEVNGRPEQQADMAGSDSASESVAAEPAPEWNLKLLLLEE